MSILSSLTSLTNIKRKLKKKMLDILFYQLLYRHNDGMYILSENWDHLIILDACRYDVFSEEIKNWKIDGKLEYRISRGSNTVEFLLENFGNFNNLHDIIYITANPYVSLYMSNKFYKVIPVWKIAWNEKFQTVMPHSVYEVTLKTYKKFGERKRLIIHFMQPHEPFIFLKLKFSNIEDTGIYNLRKGVLENKPLKSDISIWQLFKAGKLSLNEILEGYRQNLRIVMPYVINLCKILSGKVIITSDHGEAFGEKLHSLIPIKIYGHPYNRLRITPIIKVPWFITEKGKGDRKLLESELIRFSVKKLKINKVSTV